MDSDSTDGGWAPTPAEAMRPPLHAADNAAVQDQGRSVDGLTSRRRDVRKGHDNAGRGAVLEEDMGGGGTRHGRRRAGRMPPAADPRASLPSLPFGPGHIGMDAGPAMGAVDSSLMAQGGVPAATAPEGALLLLEDYDALDAGETASRLPQLDDQEWMDIVHCATWQVARAFGGYSQIINLRSWGIARQSNKALAPFAASTLACLASPH
eukprot:352338-Chlamydomonas_euryale.AAC.4